LGTAAAAGAGAVTFLPKGARGGGNGVERRPRFFFGIMFQEKEGLFYKRIGPVKWTTHPPKPPNSPR